MIKQVKRHLQEKFALAIDDHGYVEANPPEAIMSCDGKNIFMKENVGLQAVLGCKKYDVAKKMTSEEVGEDIKVFLRQVQTHFSR